MKPSNITQLRDELLSVFEDLKNGTVERVQAAELNNTAGKIIGTMKVQLEYHALRKEQPDIKFMKESKDHV